MLFNLQSKAVRFAPAGRTFLGTCVLVLSTLSTAERLNGQQLLSPVGEAATNIINWPFAGQKFGKEKKITGLAQ